MDRSSTPALLLVLLSICAGPAIACRRTEPSLDYAYRNADAVAKVRIESVADPSADGSIVAKAVVVTAWKTEVPPHISIVTGEDCAYLFRAHTSYILYLSRSADSWGTYRCRGNRLLVHADRATRWLERHGRLIRDDAR